MDGETIKSFLVGLGWDVDEISLAKFNRAITKATLEVTALYATIKTTAAAVAFGITKVSESFEQIGYEYRIIAPALNKTLVLRNELLKAYRLAGLDIVQTIKASIRLNMAVSKLKFAFQALYQSVASRFFERLTKQSDQFRKTIYANMPKIQRILEKLVNFIFKSLDATTALGTRLWGILTRVYDFFVLLDKETEGWSTIILAVIAAWKLLSATFLQSPLGRVIAIGAAILALWDDFKTFREGGQSLINWGSNTTKVMVGLAATIGAVAAAIAAGKAAITGWLVLGEVITLLKGFNTALSVTDALLLITEAPFWAIVAAVAALVAGLTALDAKWNIFHGNLTGFFGKIGEKVMDFLDPKTSAGALNGLNFKNFIPSAPPLGTYLSPNNSQTNQNVHQQTNINIQGSADAAATGKAAASEQSKVNFDLIRNMKGATR